MRELRKQPSEHRSPTRDELMRIELCCHLVNESFGPVTKTVVNQRGGKVRCEFILTVRKAGTSSSESPRASARFRLRQRVFLRFTLPH